MQGAGPERPPRVHEINWGGAVIPGRGPVGRNNWGDWDKGALTGPPLVQARSLWEMASVGALRSPQPAQGAFPEGRPAFLASREGSETFPFGPTGRGSGSRGLRTAPTPRGERKRACLEARPRLRPAGKSRLWPCTESPAPVLIWAAGSGSATCPTSFLPNLVWMSRGPCGGKARRSSRAGGASP